MMKVIMWHNKIDSKKDSRIATVKDAYKKGTADHRIVKKIAT
jgi:hypothetical protein